MTAIGRDLRHAVRALAKHPGLRRAITMAAAGIVCGLAAAWLLRRIVETLLFGITAGDRLTYIAVAGVLTSVAMIASALPALRATRVDPLTALRID